MVMSTEEISKVDNKHCLGDDVKRGAFASQLKKPKVFQAFQWLTHRYSDDGIHTGLEALHGQRSGGARKHSAPLMSLKPKVEHL